MIRARFADFIAGNGVPMRVRIIYKGDAYGRDGCIVAESDMPLVEFYDRRYDHTEHGQFISRYYLKSLLDRGYGGLLLDGGVPAWQVSADNMSRTVLPLLAAAMREEKPIPLET